MNDFQLEFQSIMLVRVAEELKFTEGQPQGGQMADNHTTYTPSLNLIQQQKAQQQPHKYKIPGPKQKEMGHTTQIYNLERVKLKNKHINDH